MRGVRVSLSCGVNDESGEGWTGQGGLQEEGALDGAQRWSLPSQLAFLSLMVTGEIACPPSVFRETVGIFHPRGQGPLWVAYGCQQSEDPG